MSFFGDLERLVADLYPYRWPITIGLLAVLGALAWFAYVREWHLVIARHKWAAAFGAAVVLAVAIPAGNYLLSPLWERSFLQEESPLARAAGPDATATSGADGIEREPAATIGEMPFEPRAVGSGLFSGADDLHFGEGQALLIETAPGQFTVRFEDFSVRNGPDLFVYLTPDKDSVDGAINLGGLKATDGAFNYEVPAGTDIAQFRYAIVWCRQFEVLFASAPLDGGA